MSGSQEVNGDDEEEWQRIILEAWQWTKSGTGNMGILLQQDMDKIVALGGSKRYNDSAKQVALLLFCRFAKDSENKKALTPTEHKWAKRRKPRKGAGKAVKATVIHKRREHTLEAIVLTKTNTKRTEKAEDMSRSELQELAKRHRIKANQKSKDIIQQLTEKGNVFAEGHPAVQWSTSDTEASGVDLDHEDRGIQPMEIDWEQGQEEQSGQEIAHSNSEGKAGMEIAMEKKKLKNKKVIAAEKRKRQKANRLQERITEEAKKIERRRKRVVV